MSADDLYRSKPMSDTRQYPAVITRVVDGDTFEADVDVGFGITVSEKFRLAGVDTPETFRATGDELERGQAATELVRAAVTPLHGGKRDITLTVRKRKGKWGRWIAGVRIRFIDEEEDAVVQVIEDLGEYLVAKGLAERVE